VDRLECDDVPTVQCDASRRRGDDTAVDVSSLVDVAAMWSTSHRDDAIEFPNFHGDDAATFRDAASETRRRSHQIPPAWDLENRL